MAQQTIRAEEFPPPGTRYHVMSFDITQYHDRTVPELSRDCAPISLEPLDGIMTAVSVLILTEIGLVYFTEIGLHYFTDIRLVDVADKAVCRTDERTFGEMTALTSMLTVCAFLNDARAQSRRVNLNPRLQCWSWMRQGPTRWRPSVV